MTSEQAVMESFAGIIQMVMAMTHGVEYIELKRFAQIKLEHETTQDVDWPRKKRVWQNRDTGGCNYRVSCRFSTSMHGTEAIPNIP